jgi:hypothetical protein
MPLNWWRSHEMAAGKQCDQGSDDERFESRETSQGKGEQG